MNDITDSKWKPFRMSVYLYNFLQYSSVKNVVSLREYMNAKHRKGGGCMKIYIQLGIKILGEEICLR
jgi:hypothetical protein